VAMEVHREMGSVFLEAVYQECFEIELRKQEIPFKSQCNSELFYSRKKIN
jgi:GxxExxY protein